MIRTTLMAVLSIALAACGQSSSTEQATPAQSNAAPEATQTASGDPCSLLADPVATFGQPVTAQQARTPNGTNTCEWRAADGRICGSVVVFGPGWNESLDVPRSYGGMVTSLGAFGSVQEVAELGEEARVVDGGMLGAQLAFRTNKTATLVGGSCGVGPGTNVALAEKVAREIVHSL